MTSYPFYVDDNDPPAKRRILEEGLRLFAERGLSSTSIRDIAASTGYSNPALYKHFKTKEALAVTLFVRSYKELLARMTVALNREAGFADRFHAYVTAYTELYDAHPHAVIFISDNLASLWPQVPNDLKKRTMITLTRELLQQGRQEGLVEKGVDLSLQVTLVIGMLSQLTRQLYLGTLAGPARTHTKEVVRILRAGLT